MQYVIQIQGYLDDRWSDWFSGMTISVQPGQGPCPPITTLSGWVNDQACLRGILTQIWDLNLTLVSVNRISDQASHDCNIGRVF